MSNLNTWTTEGFNDLQQVYTISPLNVIGKRIVIQDEEITEVKIYNFTGTLISTNLDLSDLPEGMYIVIAKTKTNQIITKKIHL
jgi:hypothetical protein